MSVLLERSALQPFYRADEANVLRHLLDHACLSPEARARVFEQGKRLLTAQRARADQGWIDKFLQHYRLDTQEGLALLSLAEAYLRVPDPRTAEALLRDKLGGMDWRAHLAKSDSLLVNSATFGLLLTQALMGEAQQSNALKRLIARTSEPVVRTMVGAAMKMMGEQFVLGRTIEEALSEASRRDNQDFRYSFDMLGESARTHADAERYFKSYLAAVEAVGVRVDHSVPLEARASISVKLSALHPRYEEAQAPYCLPDLQEKLRTLALLARQRGVGLTLDAEESERLELSMDVLEALANTPALEGWDGLGLAIQAYQKRALPLITWVNALAANTKRRFQVRLVKGAYWDSEIKRTQERGLSDYAVFTRKAATDVSYLACARAMLASPHIYSAFASHNASTVAHILELAGTRRDFEFQRLHGMGLGLYEDLIKTQGYAARVYAPVGGHRDLLAYLVRRLLENGANSSFVHKMADMEAPMETLLADPVTDVEAHNCMPHPRIPKPAVLYGTMRDNARGIDITDRALVAKLLPRLANTPLPALPQPAQAHDVGACVARADNAFAAWTAMPVETRARALEEMARLMRQSETELQLLSLLVQEAHKTLPDAIAELREAEDFCRYYALLARQNLVEQPLPGPTGEVNTLRLVGRGVFACISPWNFPLAIFLGQVCAALVTGNCVVAKPAPQTPRIALKALDLLHQAGIPHDVVQLVLGEAQIGHTLVANPSIAGVAFTGSTTTAKSIAKTLLEAPECPLTPFIAETGGLNAMVVDSTALPEQVVGDVITSAFGSAGQRCSALRLLLLQEDIAEPVLDMLKGAMDCLRLGDPGALTTDVGPLIDAQAQAKVLGYIAAHQSAVLHQCAIPQSSSPFVPPTLIRLNHIAELTQEVFGPVLHVATWSGGMLETVVKEINALGYGLTLGVHSRLASVVEQVKAQARVGNLYINRSMIGAVVGVQPFGGEGLSGTGPKAGGPHYLQRFTTERTLTIDTTSAGGNASLLSLEDTPDAG
jgi:RHH-type transcriptional regulator, proline utilization regulon repressor / proline dehydrogenase / delta 1-pyrroline-5-carboxylate dehydrogenase